MFTWDEFPKHFQKWEELDKRKSANWEQFDIITEILSAIDEYSHNLTEGKEELDPSCGNQVEMRFQDLFFSRLAFFSITWCVKLREPFKIGSSQKKYIPNESISISLTPLTTSILTAYAFCNRFWESTRQLFLRELKPFPWRLREIWGEVFGNFFFTRKCHRINPEKSRRGSPRRCAFTNTSEMNIVQGKKNIILKRSK